VSSESGVLGNTLHKAIRAGRLHAVKKKGSSGESVGNSGSQG
jgi:hypothetical protein